MTSLPATVFRFEERGLLRPGYWADLIVFDRAKCATRPLRTTSLRGRFVHVLVNGVPVIQNHELTGARPGRVLRHRAAADRRAD